MDTPVQLVAVGVVQSATTRPLMAVFFMYPTHIQLTDIDGDVHKMCASSYMDQVPEYVSLKPRRVV